MTAVTFDIVATVETTLTITKNFPVFLELWDGSDRTAWEFFVRIDTPDADRSRVDFLMVDSDGKWEFRTEFRSLKRLGEFFRHGNGYTQCAPPKFYKKIDELRAALDSIPPVVCCQEAALGLPFYAPCNKPAVAIVGWKGRRDPPIPMCPSCLNHNVSNRGGEIIRYVEDWSQEDSET